MPRPELLLDVHHQLDVVGMVSSSSMMKTPPGSEGVERVLAITQATT